MLNSISLAPLRYDNKMFAQFFETISIRSHKLINGVKVFTANSYIKESLIPGWKSKNQLYSSCDGSGTAVHENEAIYKSISEGIERLAFYENAHRSDLGFREDCSTSGMAAFPGLFPSAAQNIAYMEAVERWSIQEFWSGGLGVEQVFREGRICNVHLRTPFVGIHTVISYLDFTENGEPRRAFGFASHRKLEKAVSKAYIELSRNHEILTNLCHNMEFEALNILEKRLLHFSAASGIEQFDRILFEAIHSRKPISKSPKLSINSKISGSWDNVCHVHRILFDGMASNSSSLNHFSF